jgi:two-component system, OmpR family, KDP operon response regulator KdpE
MAAGTAFYPVLKSRTSAPVVWSEGRLLIVSEDERVRRALHSALYSLGFNVGEAVSGEEALALGRIIHFDVVLVDANMSGKDGIQICAELRPLLPRGAILVHSVDGDDERKLEALEAGADDYLIRPIHMGELTARIRATLRPAVTTAAQTEEVVVIGEVSLDSERRIVRKSGHRVYLTPKEFELINCLMADPGMPVTHARLLHVLWNDEPATRVDCLRNLVRQLRKKLEDDPGAPRYVLTESHIGYRFAGPADASKSRRV